MGVAFGFAPLFLCFWQGEMVSLKFEHISGKTWFFDMHRATGTFARPTGLIAAELKCPWGSVAIYD